MVCNTPLEKGDAGTTHDLFPAGKASWHSKHCFAVIENKEVTQTELIGWFDSPYSRSEGRPMKTPKEFVQKEAIRYMLRLKLWWMRRKARRNRRG